MGRLTGKTQSREEGRAALNRVLYRLGWRWGPLLPERFFRAVARLGARLAARRPGSYLRRWQRTVGLATGVFPDRRLTEQAVESYIRNLGEELSLSGWSRERILSTVSADPVGDERMREAISERGVVLALPHMGNWDLAGAWVCATGLQVSTVAEQLGAPEFKAFVEFRERLGMTVYSHKNPAAVRELIADAQAGKLICLVADRDLSGRGVPVAWAAPGGSLPVTMPAGPALIARSTGALFMAIACHYTSTGMHISFSDPIEHRPGAHGLATMMQDVADFFSMSVIAHPADWHLFQPFFAADR